jgi:subfamily B ATP-binding cassette protein MsbA
MKIKEQINIMDELKEKNKKISFSFRMSPIMETFTGVMIAFLIFYSGKLILKK